MGELMELKRRLLELYDYTSKVEREIKASYTEDEIDEAIGEMEADGWIDSEEESGIDYVTEEGYKALNRGSVC